MKNYVLALAVIGLVSVATHAQGLQWSEKELAGAVDALVQPEADAGLLSGTLLIAQGDRILLQRTYGFANWELRAPVTTSSRFAIASITKVMTAALAEKLTKEGRLDLDAPVRRYLPGFPDGPKGGAPTVRQLLDAASTEVALVQVAWSSSQSERRNLRPWPESQSPPEQLLGAILDVAFVPCCVLV